MAEVPSAAGNTGPDPPKVEIQKEALEEDQLWLLLVI